MISIVVFDMDQFDVVLIWEVLKFYLIFLYFRNRIKVSYVLILILTSPSKVVFERDLIQCGQDVK